MDILYAPWRSSYSQDVSDKKQENASEEQCVFCTQIAENQDEQNGIIKRFEHSVIMLNKYPYNAGHCLILPKKHVPDLQSLSAAERAELMELMNASIQVIKDTLRAQGLNVGMNIGKAGGAGIPAHLHIHILPRWQGDSNFMPSIAQTKVISFDLKDIYQKLVQGFEAVKI